MTLSRNAPCPCGSGRKAKGCCAPALEGQPAATPEALMRSRYTAYATGDVGYLMATTAPESRWARADRATWRAELVAWCSATRFLGLTVHAAEATGDLAHVRFTARLEHRSQDASFTEHSRFVRRDGRWLYVDGEPRPTTDPELPTTR